MDGDIKPVFNYSEGVRFMWPIPDDFLRTLKRPRDIKVFLCDLFDPSVRKNIDLIDLKPSISQAFNIPNLNRKHVKPDT